MKKTASEQSSTITEPLERVRLQADVAKQRVRLAKEELKRARKRLKEAKREAKRARVVRGWRTGIERRLRLLLDHLELSPGVGPTRWCGPAGGRSQSGRVAAAARQRGRRPLHRGRAYAPENA